LGFSFFIWRISRTIPNVINRNQQQCSVYSFREEFVSRALSLFVTLLFDLLVDSPLVAKRIDKLSVTSSGQSPRAPENRAR